MQSLELHKVNAASQCERSLTAFLKHFCLVTVMSATVVTAGVFFAVMMVVMIAFSIGVIIEMTGYK